MRRAGWLALLVAAVSAVAPIPARGDTSEWTCALETFTLTRDGGFEWPGGPFDEELWSVPVNGTALCERPNGTTAHRFALRSTRLDHPEWTVGVLEARACDYFLTGGSATYGGDDYGIELATPFGTLDRRPFRTLYSIETGMPDQPGRIVIDGTGTDAVWHFPVSPNRCEEPFSTIAQITVTGSFTVPLAKDNPRIAFRPPMTPGHPDPIAVDAQAQRIYVGTFTSAASVLTGSDPPDNEPSRVYAYDYAGQRVAEWQIAGQTLTEGHGLTAIALDAAGRLYVTDVNPARVVRLDPATGARETYATLSNKIPCGSGGPEGDCSSESPSNGDRGPLPNGAAFGPDGSLYVTDTTQGLIWRVPPGGGSADVWYTDNALVSVIGPNGIRLMPDQQTLLFVHSNSQLPGSTDRLQGAVYKLPIKADGSPGQLERFWLGGTNEGPDSLAVGASGNVYVALAGDGVRSGFVVLSAQGEEIARRSSPLQTLPDGTPYDTVADVAFVGDRILFTNSSNFNNVATSYAVFEYFTGERGAAILRPTVP